MAGRIPQQFLDELLDRADIVDVIDSRVTLKKSGRNFMACCPFHDEKTPSFSVQPEKQFYYCFGCGASGNALGFLMEYERLDFRPAVEQLASKYGMQIPEESREDSRDDRRRRDLYTVMENADSYYRDCLRTHPAGKQAVAYLKSRGLSAACATRFGIGFVPAGWENLLKQFESDKHAMELLLEAGMLIHRDAGGGKHRVYDRFRHRIMFPIRDSRGRTIAFGGRVMGDDKPKYLNSPETPIYHKSRELYGLYEARQANKHLQRLLVVEGYMDVIALAQHGIDYAVATLGTATSATHLQMMFRHCEELVFCFDGDQAGSRAARRALDVALPVLQDGMQLRFLFLPDGEDPDSLVQSEGPERFVERLEAAQPLSEYLFAVASAGLDTQTADGKAAMSRRALELIGKMAAGAFPEILQAELATRTGLSTEAVAAIASTAEQEPEQAERPAPPPVFSPPIDPEEVPGGMPPPDEAWYEVDQPAVLPRRPLRSKGPPEPMSLVETAIGLLVYKPQLIAKVGAELELDELQDHDAPLLLQLVELLLKRPDSSTGMLLGYWYGQPEGEKLTELCGRGIELLREGMEALGQAELSFEAGVEQRFIDTMARLRAQLSKHRLDSLLLQIEELQRRGQAPPEALQAELKSLLSQRTGGHGVQSEP